MFVAPKYSFFFIGCQVIISRMLSESVIIDFNIPKQVPFEFFHGFIFSLMRSLFFKELKKASATALSRQLPFLDMLLTQQFASRQFLKSFEAYWIPRSNPRLWCGCQLSHGANCRLSVSFPAKQDEAKLFGKACD